MLFSLSIPAQKGSAWLLVPAAFSLLLFVWLLTLHPAASGRVYVAYGGPYVIVALLWLRVIEGIKLSPFDYLAHSLLSLAWVSLFGDGKPASYHSGSQTSMHFRHGEIRLAGIGVAVSLAVVVSIFTGNLSKNIHQVCVRA